MRKAIVTILFLCFICACENQPKTDQKSSDIKETTSAKKQMETSKTATLNKSANDSLQADQESKATKNTCSNANVGDNKIIENQTFAFNFEPFKGSCFVTSHNPEYDEPPTAVELALYKDGEKIYTFDSRFNPNSVNCRVEAISFKDLNRDDLQDVIVVGKCGTKSADIIANEVFMNTGKMTFKTKTSANDKLENLKNVEEITDFVKKNEELFFK